ncbi:MULTISPECIES: shikimate kinase [Parachlamydia]|jgi:shikimate kinase|uniref:shikimate kinase n=1 Tax=Parachlamydia TaxID=83551 RepID=UPI0002D448F0|nr:shikimate kinase [Parachlamydia acanthamoebae]
MNIVLCGLPMSGKTTVGKRLSIQLNWTFIDTDEMIECAYEKEFGEKLSCRQIYRKEGESFFRKLENEQVLTLENTHQSVIATGGGTFHVQKNVQILQDNGILFYLMLSPEEAWKRTAVKGIPAFLEKSYPEQAFYAIAEKRLPLYAASSHVTIEAHCLTVEEITAAILNHEEIKHGQ